jgi:hypothetical protein
MRPGYVQLLFPLHLQYVQPAADVMKRTGWAFQTGAFIICGKKSKIGGRSIKERPLIAAGGFGG